MSKSSYAVGGIGIAACLLLTFMMQHLVKVRQGQSSSPVATDLEDVFGTYLAGRVQVATARQNGAVTMTIRMIVKPGVLRERLVASADSLLWRQLALLKEPPELVRVEVEDEGGAPAVVINLRPPRFVVPSKAAPKSAAPGNPSSAPPQQR
ncbi:hypothetical protein LBMAG49_06490 [Planctomycetota bacterium]|nr:hypothetical protein LBMAG49_06490 [Planctomycetota bacterium]